MLNLEYHKGYFCVYGPKFCQEGYCPGCEIYLKKSSPTKVIDQHETLPLHEVASRLSASL
jgi:hypothetical protein